MLDKKRKLNQEELDLWKKVTKEDIKLKSYETEVVNEKKTKVKNIKNIKLKDEQDNKIKKKIVLSNPIQINKRMKLRLERGLIKPEATLDLHGNTQVEAIEILEKFIISSISNDFRCVLVITGRRNTKYGAKGVIREKLPLWLKNIKLKNSVLYHCYASVKDGADGARYVLLRKKEKVLDE